MKKSLINLYIYFSNRSYSSHLSNRCFRYIRIGAVLLINFVINPNSYFRTEKRKKLDPLERDPLVSIIIPTFNQCQYLRQCLDSINKQTYKNYEVIIVNDGSTDETQAVLKEYFESNKITIIENPTNIGLPKSLNVGFNQAKGRLVTWISSDNYISSDYLESFVALLTKNPEASIAYSDFGVVDDNGKEIEASLGWRNYDRITRKSDILVMHKFKDVEKVNPINIVGASFMMRREVFEEVGGYYGTQGTEDQVFWISASKLFTFLKLETYTTLYFYRVHKNSLTWNIASRDYWSLLKRKSPEK